MKCKTASLPLVATVLLVFACGGCESPGTRAGRDDLQNSLQLRIDEYPLFGLDLAPMRIEEASRLHDVRYQGKEGPFDIYYLHPIYGDLAECRTVLRCHQGWIFSILSMKPVASIASANRQIDRIEHLLGRTPDKWDFAAGDAEFWFGDGKERRMLWVTTKERANRSLYVATTYVLTLATAIEKQSTLTCDLCKTRKGETP